MFAMTVGQRVGIEIKQPGERADAIVKELVAIANTSAGVGEPDDAGLIVVKLTQGMAEAAAESLRTMASRVDPGFAEVVDVYPLPPDTGLA